MQTTDSLIIGYDVTTNPDGDNTVLIVGKKKGKTVEIINAFHGEEAIDIWKKLTEVKKGLDE